MADSVQMMEALDNRVRRRDERREFFRAAFGIGALAAGGAAALSFSTRANAQSATLTDADILNFALNLEYLEAQFYAYAATGAGLSNDLLTGQGQQGPVTADGVPSGGVPFADAAIRAYAREIAADEIAHVRFLRTALGSAAVAQPAIDISGTANGPFTAAAVAAGVDLSASGGVFNPYADENSFLLGAYIFEDVGVTAYKGASPLVQNKTFLQAAAGILAVEAYHAAMVRTTLYARGIAAPALITIADQISDARDFLDGRFGASNGAINTSLSGDLDQGLSPTTVSGQLVANIVPTDTNGLAFSRTPGQVLDIVYLNLATAAATMGGFFPAGVNGNLRVSAGRA